MFPELSLVSSATNDAARYAQFSQARVRLSVFCVCVSCCTDGIEFFWSENGVLLTAGDAEGSLPPKYFSRALRLRPTSKKKKYHTE